MQSDREHNLWLWSAGTMSVFCATCIAVAGGLDATRKHYPFFTSTPIIVAYLLAAAGVLCVAGAVRGWPFPLMASPRKKDRGLHPSQPSASDHDLELLRELLRKGQRTTDLPERVERVGLPRLGSPHGSHVEWVKKLHEQIAAKWPERLSEFETPLDIYLLPHPTIELSRREPISEREVLDALRHKLDALSRLVQTLPEDSAQRQKRQQAELSALMHRGASFADNLAALRAQGINDLMIIEASYLAWDVDAWFDDSFEWVKREKAELIGLLTPIRTPTPPRAIDILPGLIERRGKELRDVFYRLG